MKVTSLELPEVLLIEPRVHRDSRGTFRETWSALRYGDAGVRGDFVQDNLSMSRLGVVRGLHLQVPVMQAKLVSVAAGEVFDVAVDVRLGSPTFGRWVGTRLSADDGLQLYIPAGFAHGFAAVTDDAVLSYKCSAYFDPGGELAVRWNDPDVGIAWPVSDPIVSERDAAAPLLRDIADHALPPYRSPGD